MDILLSFIFGAVVEGAVCTLYLRKNYIMQKKERRK